MKVLIISHLPMATQNNMGKTFLSLFSGFEKNELCQLYIYPSFPDVDRCSSYYRVTDKEVLSSVLKGKTPGSEIEKSFISESQGLYEKAEDESFYRNKKNKSAARRLLRDAMWRLGRWYNKNLENWLEKEKPDCIFVAPGAAMFIYNISMAISKKRNIPIITYICDEYYFVKEPSGILEKTRLCLLKSKIKELMKKSSGLAVICDELKQDYEKEFGITAKTVMTGTSYPISESIKVPENPKTICYFGNIRCNRYVSLGEIGKALDSVNEKSGTDYILKIYTSEKDPEIIGSFDGIKSIELCGFVTGKEFEKAFYASDILLHTEAFDEKSMDFVRHSVSTKIADSLGSGILLFAYGPENISSMQHLIRNNCAMIASSKEELEDMLTKAFSDSDERKKVAEKALETAKIYHDSKNSGKMLREFFEEII